MSDFAARRLFGPVNLQMVATILYTVPPQQRIQITNISVVNSNAVDGIVDLSINGAPGVTTRILRTPIAGDDTTLFSVIRDGIILNAGDQLWGGFGNADGTIMASGERLL